LNAQGTNTKYQICWARPAFTVLQIEQKFLNLGSLGEREVVGMAVDWGRRRGGQAI
jgi:hypothetical protein